MNKCKNCQLEFNFECGHEDCLKAEISEAKNPTRVVTVIPTDANTMASSVLKLLNDIDRQNNKREQQVRVDYYKSNHPEDRERMHDIWQMCLKSEYMKSMGPCSMECKQKPNDNTIVSSVLDWIYDSISKYDVIRVLDPRAEIKGLKSMTDELIADNKTSINVGLNSYAINRKKFLAEYPTRDMAEMRLYLIQDNAECCRMDAFSALLFEMNVYKFV